MNFFLTRILPVLCVFVQPSQGQPSPDAVGSPELKNLRTSYEQQKAVLTTAAKSQINGPREKYLAALGAAQKSALAASRTADLAINGEMAAAISGSLPEAPPPDLPKSLLQDRRALATALATVSRALAPKKRDLANSYVRNLTALEDSARRGKDKAVLDAIAAEKQNALGELDSAGGGEKNRNVVANGDFSQGAETGIPEGWTRAHSWKNVKDCGIVSDGRDKFLRFRRLQTNNQSDIKPEKTIAVPARARAVALTVRMRVEGLVKGKEYDPWPGIHLTAKGAGDEKLAQADAVMKENSSGWKRLSADLELPKGSANLIVSLGAFGAAGVIDFDDVVVEFK